MMTDVINPLEVLTVGHSNRSIDEFLTVLRANHVTAIADVRSTPFSRMYPHFDRTSLSESLRAQGIVYSFLGFELGGRPRDLAIYEKGRAAYKRIAETDTFQQGIQRVLRGARQYRLALLCSEKDPLECHRGLLIAPQLERNGAAIAHILDSASVEKHNQTVERLLARFGLDQQQLFVGSNSSVIEEAYARQEHRVAYSLKRHSEDIRVGG